MRPFHRVERFIHRGKQLLQPETLHFIDAAREAADRAIKELYASGPDGQRSVRVPLLPPSSIHIQVERSGVVFRVTQTQADQPPQYDWYTIGADAKGRHTLFVLRHSSDEQHLSHEPVVQLGRSYRLDALEHVQKDIPLAEFNAVVWKKPEIDALLDSIALEFFSGQGNARVSASEPQLVHQLSPYLFPL